MDRKVKLIWDFRGPDSLHIAKHHEIHLQDFIKGKKIKDREITGTEKISEMHSIAYWVIMESEIHSYKDILKPQRATLYEE
ncbi:MAG: hypothetical protein WCD31_08620 [Gillisia sp.]